jgi:ABC-type transport system involved in multi-copper enzyme maturation permease subunit
LLWATPAVHAELDGKTWAYLTVRPAGRGPILTGKYLAAVAWSTLCAWLSLALSLGVLCWEMNVLRPGFGLAVSIFISSVVYGALFTLLGVIFLQKAMVAAVAYTALMEIIVGFVPATINHFSVQYHLRCLLSKWIVEHPLPPDHPMQTVFFSSWQPWQHLVVLLSAAVVLMTVAVALLRRRQLVSTVEA